MTVLDFSSAESALVAGDVAALSRELAARFPDDPQVQQADGLVRLALGDNSIGMELTAEARVFFESIQKARRLRSLGGEQPMPRHMEIGLDLDFIANLKGIEGWSIPQFLNFLTVRQLKPTRRTAVVGTMRDDGIYVLEWIAYYLALGFERVFIYTNDNADGSDALLGRLADHGVITLIESKTSRKVPPEVKAYEHSVQLLHALRAFEWVLYVDSDEFFVPAPRFENSIDRVLASIGERFPGRPPAAIYYAWRWYVSGMRYARTGGLLIDRFRYARPHHVTKALVHLPDVVSMRHEHYPEVADGAFVVDSAYAEVIDIDAMWCERKPQYEGGWVNHYWPKSFEEFAVKKARGQTLDLAVNSYDRPFKLFFSWNGYETSENLCPVDPGMCARVKEIIAELRSIEGVGILADQIDREFPALLERYYGDRNRVRAFYEEHAGEGPTEL